MEYSYVLQSIPIFLQSNIQPRFIKKHLYGIDNDDFSIHFTIPLVAPLVRSERYYFSTAESTFENNSFQWNLGESTKKDNYVYTLSRYMLYYVYTERGVAHGNVTYKKMGQ